MSGINIPTMVKIIHYHGLLTQPVPLEASTLSMTGAALEEAIAASAEPVAFIVLAHLWGRQAQRDAVLEVARKHGIEVFEDCAESFDGQYQGDPRATLSAFSFGTIKTCTAFGGAVVKVNDPTLLERMRALNSTYPALSTMKAVSKILIPCIMMPVLNYRPVSRVVVLFADLFGIDYLGLGVKAFRNFGSSAAGLVKKVRHQTSKANLLVLARRLRTFDVATFSKCQEKRLRVAKELHKINGAEMVGLEAPVVNFWGFTVLVPNRELFAAKLKARGFVAYCSNSQLDCVPVSTELESKCRVDPTVYRIVNDTLYLPVFLNTTDHELNLLTNAIRETMNDPAVAVGRKLK